MAANLAAELARRLWPNSNPRVHMMEDDHPIRSAIANIRSLADMAKWQVGGDTQDPLIGMDKMFQSVLPAHKPQSEPLKVSGQDGMINHALAMHDDTGYPVEHYLPSPPRYPAEFPAGKPRSKSKKN